VKLYICYPLALAGPGIIVMVADNDAGGITTYAALEILSTMFVDLEYKYIIFVIG